MGSPFDRVDHEAAPTAIVVEGRVVSPNAVPSILGGAALAAAYALDVVEGTGAVVRELGTVVIGDTLRVEIVGAEVTICVVARRARIESPWWAAPQAPVPLERTIPELMGVLAGAAGGRPLGVRERRVHTGDRVELRAVVERAGGRAWVVRDDLAPVTVLVFGPA